MSLSPLDPCHWLERLQERTEFDGYGLVFDALRATDPSGGGIDGYHAYVMPARDRGSPQANASQLTRQKVTTTIQVLIATKVYNNPRGGQAAQDFTPLRAQVLDALVGWKPPDACTTVKFDAGILGRFIDETKVATWLDTYRTEYWLNKRHA